MSGWTNHPLLITCARTYTAWLRTCAHLMQRNTVHTSTPSCTLTPVHLHVHSHQYTFMYTHTSAPSCTLTPVHLHVHSHQCTFMYTHTSAPSCTLTPVHLHVHSHQYTTGGYIYSVHVYQKCSRVTLKLHMCVDSAEWSHAHFDEAIQMYCTSLERPQQA